MRTAMALVNYNQTASNVTTLLQPEQMQTITYIDMVTTSLSIVGASSVIIYSFCKRKVCQPEVHPLFHLACADLLASLFLLLGVIIFNLSYVTMELYEQHCHYFSAFASSFFVTTFLLTITYSLEVFLRMRDRAIRSSTRQPGTGNFPLIYLLYIISWLGPLLVQSTILITTSSEPPFWDVIPSPNSSLVTCTRCLPLYHFKNDECMPTPSEGKQWMIDLDVSSKLIFILLLILTIVITTIVYLLAVAAFQLRHRRAGMRGRREYEDERSVRRRAALYLIVFCFCWLPTLVLGILSLCDGFVMKKYYVLYIMQACTAPLQGFLNCIVYGWRRREFRTVKPLPVAVLAEQSGLLDRNRNNYRTFATTSA
ncbi:PREDICTED: transmembrane protein 116-like [Branchiostoma belcheri]|uniref:Transmembrane protein 116-like n=1 Tax=Branchiostoma belcheri TaxID=7741 RepID=A0A6P4YEZ2_BRABE|nr:PREDICTED: transmembrane protein 116-like [Branchiostoma belcheri]